MVGIRLGISDAPVFQKVIDEERVERVPVLEVLKRQPKQVALTALLPDAGAGAGVYRRNLHLYLWNDRARGLARFPAHRRAFANRAGFPLGHDFRAPIRPLLCGIANSLETLVLYRIGQGLSGALIMPMGQAIVLATFPRELHATVMVIWGFGSVVGPVVGPVLGSMIAETYSWRAVFFMIVPPLLALPPQRPYYRGDVKVPVGGGVYGGVATRRRASGSCHACAILA
jgi:MFS family permease